MIGIAQNFEQMATQLKPATMVSLGLVATLVGLFIWLCGLGFRRILAAVIGLVGGGVCGFSLTERNIALTCLSTAVGLVIALTFERILVTGSLFGRLILALCYAALGTALTFAGMILLLMYKGAMPVNHIRDRLLFYGIIFIAMTFLGTFEQLLLCRRVGKQLTSKKHKNKTKVKSEETSTN